MTSSDTEQQTQDAPADRLRQAAGVVREASAAATPGVWTAHLLPPNEHHKHPAHWVKAKYDDGSTESSQVVADCPWRQTDAAWIALMSPPVGEPLAVVFEAWAFAVELDPDVVNRTGGLETVALADQILAAVTR